MFIRRKNSHRAVLTLVHLLLDKCWHLSRRSENFQSQKEMMSYMNPRSGGIHWREREGGVVGGARLGVSS